MPIRVCSSSIGLFFFLLFCNNGINANLWSESARMEDLQQWRALCGRYQVAQAYMEDSNARITVIAPVNDVFLYNPDLRAMDQKETLSHIVDTQVVEISQGTRWEKQTLIRSTINSGYVYITQFENNPGNFSYYANAGRICNHESNQWGIISGEQYLYKTCTPMGHRPYPGTCLAFIRDDDNTLFVDRQYDNRDLTELRDVLNRVPDIALVIYGSSAWNGFHTFFLPTNKAFAKVIDRNRIDREVLLAHVSGMNRVLFSYAWLYDGGLHYYPSVRFSSNIIEDNFKLKLTMRNITDHRTGKWDLYAVSEIYERYSQFRRGAVWAKILVPNIPVQNGVAHIIDNVLGIVSTTIDQMVMDNYRCTTLMRYINTIGQIVRNYFSATGGLVTFFAPWNEAFERIPEAIERRLLRDRIWLEQILKLHIVPAKELTTDEITNETIVATVDNIHHLYFIRGEWPKNNVTYYVIGGGVKTAIQMDNIAATNGIIHYIDRVLGVPYQSMWEIIRNETRLQRSYRMLDNLQLRYALDPWQVLTPEQNFTFFIPTDEAWDKVPMALTLRMNDGNHWDALQYVYKRHIIQGQALMYTDLRERTYVMMNDEKVVVRRRGRYFELYWPRGNRVARVIEGGEIAGINGFMHMIDNVLIYEPDLHAGGCLACPSSPTILLAILLSILANRFLQRHRNAPLWIGIIFALLLDPNTMFNSSSSFGARSGNFFGQSSTNTLGSNSFGSTNTMSPSSFGQTNTQSNPTNPNNDIEVAQAPEDTIQALRFSPQVQGNPIFLAAGSWDFTCRVWQINDNGTAEAKALQNVGAPVLGIDWFDDSSKIFMACADKQLRLWDLGSNQVSVVGAHDAPALSCHWITSPAYSCLLSSGWDKTLRFWDMRQLPTQSSMATIQLPDRVYCTDVVYPLGVVALANRHVKLYKLDGNPQEVQDAESQLKYQSRCVSIFKSKDTGQPGGYALGSIEGRVAIQNIQPEKSRDNFTFKCHRSPDLVNGSQEIYPINDLCFHPIHYTLATVGGDGRYMFWDKDARTKLKNSEQMQKQITKCHVHQSGNIFAYATGYDWSKGHEHNTQPTNSRIFLHRADEDMRPKRK